MFRALSWPTVAANLVLHLPSSGLRVNMISKSLRWFILTIEYLFNIMDLNLMVVMGWCSLLNYRLEIENLMGYALFLPSRPD